MEIRYQDHECCACGVMFGVTPGLHRALKESMRPFYCPNGHGQYFAKSTSDQLREDLARKALEIDDLRGQVKELSRFKRRCTKRRAGL